MGLSGLLMVLVGYESNDNREWNGWFSILITSIFLRDCYLQNTNFLSLSDKESVNLRVAIAIHVSGTQVEIKAAPVLIRLFRLFTP